MKLSHLLLAAGLCSFSAASAQTTPSSPNTKGTASADAPISGMPAQAAHPRGNVSSGEVFTTGDPNGNRMRNKDMSKRKKMKGSMEDGSGKMKTKM